MYLPTLLMPTPSTITIPLQITTYPLLPASYHLPYAQPPPMPPAEEQDQSEAQPVKVEEVEEDEEGLPKERVKQEEEEKEKPKKAKRPYKKRRTNLPKFQCDIQGCFAPLSSKMSYRNHLRLQHDIRIRYNKKRNG